MGQRRRILTVILTSRNRHKLLTSAIASVYAQTFKEWELIIADDDSQDLRIHELYKQLELDPYITILRGAKVPAKYRKDHKMNAVRINAAIQMANGRYITYLADDNVWLTTRCERMMKVFQKDQSVDVVVEMARWITWDGRKFPQDHFQYRYNAPFEKGHKELLKIIAPSNFIVNDCVIHKSPRRCARCEHWPIDHTQTPVDWRYWLKLLNEGSRFVKLTDVGTVAYFPGTWKHVSVKQAMNHRQEPNEEIDMSKKLKRRARVAKETREKKKAKSNQDRWCVNSGTSKMQWTHPLTNKFMECESGGRVRESAVKMPGGGILAGFTYESRHEPKPLKEILKEKPAEPQDFGFVAVEDKDELTEDKVETLNEEDIATLCSSCGKEISPNTKTGLCRKCYNESRKKK